MSSVEFDGDLRLGAADQTRQVLELAPTTRVSRAPDAEDVAAVLAAVGEAVYIWDIGNDALTWHGDVESVLGVTPASIASSADYGARLDADNLVSRFETILMARERDEGDGVFFQIQYAFEPDGGGERTIWVEDTGRWYAGEDGRPRQAVGVVRAINERHEREQRLSYLSRFDELTGQINRSNLMDIGRTTLANAKRYGTTGGFMFAAIDNLSAINERFGFDVADQVIAGVAKQLKASLRAGDILGRYSGNKFGLVLTRCGDGDMQIVARRLRAGVSDAVIETAAGPVCATISLGGVAFPNVASSMRDIVAYAQEALDQAKGLGQDSFVAFQISQDRDVQRQQNLRAAAAVVSALEFDSFVLALQPVVDASTKAPNFYECLLRIDDGNGGLKGPGQLVPAAEKLGMIHLIDRHTLALCVSILKAEPDFHLSLNVSAGASGISDWVSLLFDQTGGSKELISRLIVEITETTAIENLDATARFVDRIHSIGARVAMDDFGAGYTSFRNLRQLDIDMVKIDGSYVRGCDRSASDRAFIRALLDLANSLGIKAVAEWVENDAEADVLRQLGVDYLQGFGLGEPRVWRRDGEQHGIVPDRLAG